MEQQDSTVWPPPLGTVSLATWFPFRFLDLRVQGKTPDFRGGSIGIEPTGIIIHGKVAPRVPGTIILWSAFVLTRHWMPRQLWPLVLAAVVVVALLLYVFRKTRTLILPWSQVHQIVLDKEKHRAGIVYDVPDKDGKLKTYSLVFALSAVLYPSFVSAAEQYAPGRGLDDQLRGESLAPLLVPALNGLVVLLVAYLASRLLLRHH